MTDLRPISLPIGSPVREGGGGGGGGGGEAKGANVIGNTKPLISSYLISKFQTRQSTGQDFQNSQTRFKNNSSCNCHMHSQGGQSNNATSAMRNRSVIKHRKEVEL